jgi:hypothetical protein
MMSIPWKSLFQHPVRDTGVDLLVSDHRNREAVSLQVKFSKDFLVTHMAPEFQQQLRACGWWMPQPREVGELAS